MAQLMPIFLIAEPLAYRSREPAILAPTPRATSARSSGDAYHNPRVLAWHLKRCPREPTRSSQSDTARWQTSARYRQVMGGLKRLRSPTASVLFFRLVGIGLTLVSTLITERVVGPTEFGYFATALALAAVFSVPTVSLERLALREVHAEPALSLQPITTWLKRRLLLYTLAGAATGLATTLLVRTTADLQLVTAVAIGAALGPLLGVLTVAQAGCRAYGRLLAGQIPNEILRPALIIAGATILYGARGEVPFSAAWAGVIYVAASAAVLLWPASYYRNRDGTRPRAPTRLSHRPPAPSWVQVPSPSYPTFRHPC